MYGSRSPRLDGEETDVEGHPYGIGNDDEPGDEFRARGDGRQVVLFAEVEDAALEENLSFHVAEGVCLCSFEQDSFLKMAENISVQRSRNDCRRDVIFCMGRLV